MLKFFMEHLDKKVLWHREAPFIFTRTLKRELLFIQNIVGQKYFTVLLSEC